MNATNIIRLRLCFHALFSNGRIATFFSTKKHYSLFVKLQEAKKILVGNSGTSSLYYSMREGGHAYTKNMRTEFDLPLVYRQPKLKKLNSVNKQLYSNIKSSRMFPFRTVKSRFKFRPQHCNRTFYQNMKELSPKLHVFNFVHTVHMIQMHTFSTFCVVKNNRTLLLTSHASFTSLRHKWSRSKKQRVLKEEESRLQEVDLADVVETHVLGSGPGGQAVNKTHNAVVLRHTPTGIIVKSHLTRLVEKNREHALLELRHKLDALLHGEDSVRARQAREAAARRAKSRAESRERQAKKQEFKEREGLD